MVQLPFFFLNIPPSGLTSKPLCVIDQWWLHRDHHQEQTQHWHRTKPYRERKKSTVTLAVPKGYENFFKRWESDSESSLVCVLIKEKSAWRKSNAVVCCDQLFASVTFHGLLPTDLQRRKLFLQWILFSVAVVSGKTDISSFFLKMCFFLYVCKLHLHLTVEFICHKLL